MPVFYQQIGCVSVSTLVNIGQIHFDVAQIRNTERSGAADFIPEHAS
jgi:hypothetical protein